MADPTFITRVVLRNYRSFAGCDVPLGPLTFLIGPNGAGKSNFLDALRFVAEALRTSLDHALRERGGIHEIRRQTGTPGSPLAIGIRLSFRLPTGESGFYGFELRELSRGGFEVTEEHCRVDLPALPPRGHHYRVRRGSVEEASVPVAPAAAPDRLYLVNASGLPEFRPLYEALSRMGFYNFQPEQIRDLQSPDAGDLLARDGHNLTSVFGRLDEPTRRRVVEYLRKVVPGITAVEPRAIGSKETLELVYQGAPEQSVKFLASHMSDGTLRALAGLVALLQASKGTERVPLVGLEEPELALHPGAAGVLRGVLHEASRNTQVLVTSHSPELLDAPEIDVESILSVLSEGGESKIGPVEEVHKEAIRDKLFTVGELLRLNQLQPDPGAVKPEPFPELFADCAGGCS